MPPCPLTPAPAALYLAWPWQAPLNWLAIAVLLGLIVLLQIWGSRHQANTTERRTTAQVEGDEQYPEHPLPHWMRYMVGVTSILGFTLLAVVTFPSMMRNEAWYHRQFSSVASGNHDCSLSASTLFTIAATHQQATLDTVFIALGLGVLPWLLIVLVRDAVPWWRVRFVRPR